MGALDELERQDRVVSAMERAMQRVANIPGTQRNENVMSMATIAAFVCESMLSDPATLARAIHALPDEKRQAVLVLTDALVSGETR